MTAGPFWALVVAALLAVLMPEPASARWESVSQTPSGSVPYFVCPSRSHAARCQLIEDPTRGSHARGPLAAGAITKGPAQEVSPATFGSGVEGGYAPSDLQTAYRLPSSSAGLGQTVAVVDAFDDPKAEADLKVYRAQYGLGECTVENGCFRKVGQRGEGKLPASDKNWAREISLDLDMVSAICPSCHILLVEADNEAGANLAIAENEAVALGATEVSNSYEEAETSEHAAAYDHPGVPIVAAAGDHSYGVVSPAASTHVIAVGGTSLVPAAGRRGWEETVWHTEGGGGTGSGCSIEPKPAWQTDEGCVHRTDNDIAAVADPNTPVSAYDSFETAPTWKLLGGTSVSAPIVAAAMALTTPFTRSFDGAQALYLDRADGGSFNDVVSGANGKCSPFAYLCEAGRGYDGPSGLGTLAGAPEVPPPSAITAGVSAVSSTQAVLSGSTNPHGAALSECGFQYGPTTAYGSYVPCASLPVAGVTPVSVAATVAALAPATIYHYRLRVSYSGGSSDGADVAFTTAGVAPTVYATGSSNVTQSSATLNASVNANGTVTACKFEYGTSASYGSAVPCASSVGESRVPVGVSASLSGLSANTTYHFRVVASNADGTSYGSDQAMTLLPMAPSVRTLAPTAVGHTSATLNASVNANGGALTACAFEFNSADTLVPCSHEPAPFAGAVAVSATVAGLAPGSRFRYRIIAANAGGTTYGPLVEFVSLPTTAQLAARSLARLVSARLRVAANGEVRLKIRCPATHRVRCRGTIALRADSHAAGGHTRTLASGTFAARAGSVLTLRLQLAGFARRLLAGQSILHASAVLRTSATSGAAGVWRTAVVLTSS